MCDKTCAKIAVANKIQMGGGELRGWHTCSNIKRVVLKYDKMIFIKQLYNIWYILSGWLYLLPINDAVIQVRIRMKVPEGVKLHGAMHHPKQGTEDSNKQISMSEDGDTVTFDLDLLLSGQQCFALYASVSKQTYALHVYIFMF